MPTQLHDTFTARVSVEIQRRLTDLANKNPLLRTFIEKIRHNGGRLQLPTTSTSSKQNYIRREPDSMFCHTEAVWPGVVIEVSYSQKRKALATLADDYILETDGSIRLVIGLDLEYKGSKQATISTWRLQRRLGDEGEEYVAAQVIQDQVCMAILSLLIDADPPSLSATILVSLVVMSIQD